MRSHSSNGSCPWDWAGERAQVWFRGVERSGWREGLGGGCKGYWVVEGRHARMEGLWHHNEWYCAAYDAPRVG